MEWTCDAEGTFVGRGRRPADYLSPEAGNSNRNNIGKGIIARLRARTTGVGKYDRVPDPAKDHGKGLPVAKVNPVGVDRTLREEGIRKFMSPMETSEDTAAEWRELLEDVLMIVFRSAKPSSATDATSIKSGDPCCEHVDHMASYQIRKMAEIVGAMEISTPILRQIYACAGRYISCVSVNVDKRKMRGIGRRPPAWGKNLTDLIDVVNAVNDDLRQVARVMCDHDRYKGHI
ncbi:hypothetical protein NP493_142g04000 [Ridgeia piscesae]|uniref:Uncharacterized protein n=1 Tax=Ridgeia piscesae TaxID=27915 RepID=A0AAD9UG69_RIDPI|nr:hypothetical protein NP493_142g04000 [Ridgeia piscesae]